jgi:hypothetical protein
MARTSCGKVFWVGFVTNNKNSNQKQPGEKEPGTFHYNPGNMSGKTIGRGIVRLFIRGGYDPIAQTVTLDHLHPARPRLAPSRDQFGGLARL